MRSKHIILFLTLIFATKTGFCQLNNPDFFPTAVWLQNPTNAQAYKDAGINTYIGLWNDLNQVQLDQLTKAKMYVFCRQNDFGLQQNNDSIIMGWTQKDEPDNAQWNSNTMRYDPCIDPSIIIDNYQEIKKKDPTRPVYLNLGRGVSHLKWVGRGSCTGNINLYKEINDGYIAACDIVSFDIYPINSTQKETQNNLWYVPKGIDSLKSWSSKTRPTWTWIETTKINDQSNRKPTPAEVKSEVWMAIIHGASGIGYFCHSWSPQFDDAALLHDLTMIDSVKSINNMINKMAPILNSSNTNTQMNAISSNNNIPIDYMTKSYDNDDYIFAVAMRQGTTIGTFKAQANSTIEVVGENRTLPVINGVFKDEFKDYGVHIYKVKLATSYNLVKTDYSLKLFPNPTRGIVKFHIENNKHQDFQVRIYDNKSNLVLQSNHSKSINLENKKPGVYYVVINVDGQIIVENIVLVK